MTISCRLPGVRVLGQDHHGSLFALGVDLQGDTVLSADTEAICTPNGIS
jgi:hypothetical protein